MSDQNDAALRMSMERAAEQKHPRTCPVCMGVLDAATNLTDTSTPQDGDWSVCAYCGTVLRFTNTMALRCATVDEMQELQQVSPKMHRLITFASHVFTTKARRAS